MYEQSKLGIKSHKILKYVCLEINKLVLLHKLHYHYLMKIFFFLIFVSFTGKCPNSKIDFKNCLPVITVV